MTEGSGCWTSGLQKRFPPTPPSVIASLWTDSSAQEGSFSLSSLPPIQFHRSSSHPRICHGIVLYEISTWTKSWQMQTMTTTMTPMVSLPLLPPPTSRQRIHSSPPAPYCPYLLSAESIDPKDRASLDSSYASILDVLGPPESQNNPFGEREIKDALWDAYFDSEAVLNELMKEIEKKNKKKQSELSRSVQIRVRYIPRLSGRCTGHNRGELLPLDDRMPWLYAEVGRSELSEHLHCATRGPTSRQAETDTSHLCLCHLTRTPRR